MTCWIIVPARRGQRRKNLWLLNGKPLVRYPIAAAEAWGLMRYLLISTDDRDVMTYARDLGVTVLVRDRELAQDDTPIIDVIKDIIETPVGKQAETVVLLQPTSPFVRPNDIAECCRLLWHNHEAASAQTVAPIAHNDHAFNQRHIEDGKLEWCYPAQRRGAYNKQRKPPRHRFGNCLAFRPWHALKQDTVFPEPMLAHIISPHYAMDVDEPHDLRLAEAMLKGDVTELRHLEAPDD